MTSNRGPQFISNFWQRLLQSFGCTANLSSAYHPQTDGQTERVNQSLEQYWQCALSYQQDDFVDLLPLAEFAYNNSLHACMVVTPFFASYGLHPCFSISLPSHSINPSAEDRAHLLEDVHRDLSLELTLAREHYKVQADRLRSDTPWFEVGDLVWLLRRNITTTRLCPKLDYKKLGPSESSRK
jgi:transposase InsO family protein